MRLLLPPLVPIAFLAYLVISAWLGVVPWRTHYLTIAFLYFVSTIAALIYEALILPSALRTIFYSSTKTTILDRACVGIATLFTAFCSSLLAYGFLT
ncbi:hypothetical protein ACS5PN_26565 [Roseateles sp. NT4]|uniref:hypothetical protein n=1 Tax=Roseateles sp. NT4 TaxID=3453715 RepID=UPI003EEC69CE